MYAKLDRLRVDLQKAITKRDEADAKVKQLENKLKEEEATQIVNDVASYNMSPEQLAQFLQLANSGQLQSILNGQTKVESSQSAYGSTTSYTADDIDEEDLEDKADED